MKKHIYNEQNGLRYTLHGDVYLPDSPSPKRSIRPSANTEGCARPICRSIISCSIAECCGTAHCGSTCMKWTNRRRARWTRSLRAWRRLTV